MTNKKIWIMNHYATNMYFNKGGRHYWFARYLIDNGYEPTVFCANTRHDGKEPITIPKGKYIRMVTEKIPFVFVKTVEYRGNSIQRVINMLLFAWNMLQVAKEYARIYGKPDVILASSVHPLTLVSGIRIADKFKVPSICEIRDLWPESIIAYGLLKNRLITQLLYKGERWIYNNADKLIFTMEGGKDYIVGKGWDKYSGGPIDLKKVYHINNGVDLETFDYRKKHYVLEDKDIWDDQYFRVNYTGSIRRANHLDLIVDAAKFIQINQDLNIKFLIWGDGDEKKRLENRCNVEGIENVIFKGKVDNKYIPYIVSNSDLNILNYPFHDIWKYGGSQNKKFEYLAAGKPILSTITMGYDILEKYGAGISLDEQSSNSIYHNICRIINMSEEKRKIMGNSARRAAGDYDFKELTKRLIDLIESF